jgi:hypothetical protein
MMVIGKALSTPSSAECYVQISSAVGGLTGLFGFYDNSSGQLTWGTDNPNADTFSTIIPPVGTWAVMGPSKGSGTVAPRMHMAPIGGAAPLHGNVGNTVPSSNGAAGTQIYIGQFQDATGFHDYQIIAMAYWEGVLLPDTAYEYVANNPSLRTLRELNPMVLLRFDQDLVSQGVVDMMGVATQAAISGTSVVNDVPTGWGSDLPLMYALAAGPSFADPAINIEAEHPRLSFTNLETNQNSDPEALAIAQPYQRKTFTAAGRRWLFYGDRGTGQTQMMLTSSTDGGVTWKTPVALRNLDNNGFNVGGSYFDTHFDGTFIHYAVGLLDITATGEFIYYRRGTPNADGTITWSAAEQQVVQGTNSSVLEVSVTTDSAGKPWIIYEDFGAQSAVVVASSVADGTWSMRGGFPFTLSTDFVHWWTWIGALSGGKMVVAFWTEDAGLTSDGSTIYTRVFDGASWSSQDSIDGGSKVDGVTTNIAFVTNPVTDDTYYAFGDAFSQTQVIRRDSTGAYFGGNVSIILGAMPGLAVALNPASGILDLIGLDPQSTAGLLHYTLTSGVWAAVDPLTINEGDIHPGGMTISERPDGNEYVVAIQRYNFVGGNDPIDLFYIPVAPFVGGGGPFFINIGRVTETNAARAFTSAKSRAIVRVTETDAARAVAFTKARTLTRVIETDAARALTFTKVKAFGRVTETELARALAAVRQVAFGRVTETSLARALSSAKALLLGRVTESDLARNISSSAPKNIAVARVIETNLARALTFTKAKAITRITESDAARALAQLKQKAINRITETDAARTLANRLKSMPFGRVTETDTANQISTSGLKLIARVNGTDLVRPITRIKTTTFNRVTETDLARPISFFKVRTISRVIEIDTAQSLARVHTRQIGRVLENNTVRSLSFIFTHRIGRITELNTARPILSVLKSTLGAPPRRTGSLGPNFRPGRIGTQPSGSLHTSTDVPGRVQ